MTNKKVKLNQEIKCGCNDNMCEKEGEPWLVWFSGLSAGL